MRLDISRRSTAGRWRLRAYMLALPFTLILTTGARLHGQAPAALRMWAAQTGPDQVTLAWEPITGAAEYRIHAGDPDAASTPAARRPISTLSGSGRSAIVGGLRRFGSLGFYLVAVGSDRGIIAKVPFNEVVPVRGFVPVEAPVTVTAAATGAEEITLSWSPVPGATAYMIGRAAAGSGLQMLCALCSTETTYVDRDVIPGAAHSYAVAALYPGGVSGRTASNIVTLGSIAAAPSGPATSPQPTPQTPVSSGTPPGQPAVTTSPYTPPGQPAATTSPYTPPGQPAATMPGYVPPGQPAGTSASSAPVKTPTPWTPGGKTPPSSTPQPLNTASTTPPPGGPLGAAAQAAGNVAGQVVQTVGNVAGQVAQATGAIVGQAAGAMGGMLQQASNVPPQPHAASAIATGPCRLDYQRADNMWAAFGRPDGQLGVESITVADGQSKLFVTDWKYEKRRNDGTNYFGSHLRIATNPGQRTVKVQVFSPASVPLNLVRAIRGANGNYYVPIDPGQTSKFQADLVEVACN